MNGVWQRWGLCRLRPVGKAAVLGGVGQTITEGSFLLCACWKQQAGITVTQMSTPKLKEKPQSNVADEAHFF